MDLEDCIEYLGDIIISVAEARNALIKLRSEKSIAPILECPPHAALTKEQLIEVLKSVFPEHQKKTKQKSKEKHPNGSV
jgi:hypothetical protein